MLVSVWEAAAFLRTMEGTLASMEAVAIIKELRSSTRRKADRSARWKCWPMTTSSPRSPYPRQLRPRSYPDRSPRSLDAGEPTRATRDIGTGWAKGLTTAVLALPSALIPPESNYILNPAHPASTTFQFSEPEPLYFDDRLGRAWLKRHENPRRATHSRRASSCASEFCSLVETRP